MTDNLKELVWECLYDHSNGKYLGDASKAQRDAVIAGVDALIAEVERLKAQAEHGVYYYLASAVDAKLAKLAKRDAENQRLLDSLHATWQEIKTEIAKRDAEIAVLKDNFTDMHKEWRKSHDECDALKAENLGYAKSLLDLEAEVKRLTADARRYRWLRQYDIDSYLACGKLEQLDAAIDKAMK